MLFLGDFQDVFVTATRLFRNLLCPVTELAFRMVVGVVVGSKVCLDFLDVDF